MRNERDWWIVSPGKSFASVGETDDWIELHGKIRTRGNLASLVYRLLNVDGNKLPDDGKTVLEHLKEMEKDGFE